MSNHLKSNQNYNKILANLDFDITQTLQITFPIFCFSKFQPIQEIFRFFGHFLF